MIKTMAEERTSLLTVEQFKQLARPTGNHIDEEEVKVFIRECEDSFIIPAIGYERFKASIGQGDFGIPFFRDSMQIPSLTVANTLSMARIRAVRISRS